MHSYVYTHTYAHICIYIHVCVPHTNGKWKKYTQAATHEYSVQPLGNVCCNASLEHHKQILLSDALSLAGTHHPGLIQEQVQVARIRRNA